MQRRRHDGDDFFGLGNSFAGLRVLGRPGSLRSDFLGRRSTLGDAFFSRSFGDGPSFVPGGSRFGHQVSLLRERSDAGFLDQPPPATKSTWPLIEELSFDDEDQGEKADKVKGKSVRRPSNVQDPDEAAEGNKGRHNHLRNDLSRPKTMQPQGGSYAFRSLSVTYGGPNGAYYASSTVRRSGGDGVIVEESKEADGTNGKATHRISRGIGHKGYTVTRKLSVDGWVDMSQTFHNLNEDELPGFEEAWQESAQYNLPRRNSGHGSEKSSSAMGWTPVRSSASTNFPRIQSSVW
ncbi:hypothetical protein OPV22_010812 [Ensete ventricosum]|uniref:Uncharacterized protein n=1 Tax=Ensete ventricosum TaxID=4639 RepID=A0AAV8PVI5_ENSVE|nr:hypothetical protein OPV22_010812 [Ensete ventricosum]